MALSERWNQKLYYWFVLDAGFGKDGTGWQVIFRTPLFGFVLNRRWLGFHYVEPIRENSLYLGFISRWPAADYEPMYRWKWEKKTMAQQFDQTGGSVKDPYAVADPNQISPKFFNQVAQIAHFFAMYALTFTLAVFFGARWGVIALALCVIYALVHEFIWDPLEENAATRGSDLVDFSFLVAGGGFGAILGILLVWLHGR
jgi:hypothetical protein